MTHAGPTTEGPSRGISDDSDVLDETMVAGAEASPEPRRPAYAPGTAVSRYVILYEVGSGGMGVVYAAFDPQLNRKIALKILIPKGKERRRGADQAATRLMREAQAIARLSHPNVVNVYDVGRHGEAVFVAMEFIEGLTLTRWLERDPRSLAEIRRVFSMAGRGLAAAHRAGLVHRDFKPDNVLVSPDGRVRVLDFGLARADPTHASYLSNISHVSDVSQFSEDGESLDGPGEGIPGVVDLGESDVLSSPLTLDDKVVGTPRFMPPEQHAGVGVDARSDQFSFCVALYQALYQQDPFPANRLHDLVRLKQRGKIAPVPADAGVPQWLEGLVMRGLSPRPADRWDSMDEVVEALENDPQARRQRRMTLVGGAVLLAAATAVAGHQLGQGDRMCRDSEAHLAGLWDQARREQVRSAILGTGLAYAEHTWSEVERRLDDDLDAWVTTHRKTCEATRVRGEQSDELLDLRMRCLQDHLGEVRAVLDVLGESDPVMVQRAVAMVSGLPDLERCADIEQLRARLPPPDDEQTRQKVDQLRDLMRQAQARRAVRRVVEARELAEKVLGEAQALDYEPLRLEALATLGIVLEQTSDYAGAEARLREAMRGAIAAGHDRVASSAAIQLVSVVGDRLARYDEGLTWAELAGALLDRQEEQGVPRVGLLNNIGNVWHRKGDHAKAIEYYQQAIARREELSSAGDPAAAVERINLGNAQLALGRYEEALANYQQAEATLRQTLGTGHPQIATAVASIGLVYNETGRYQEALQQHYAALSDFEAWLGPEHLFVATTIGNIGAALHGQGKLEQAFEKVRQAQELFEKAVGADHPQVAATLHNLGAIRKDQGFYDEAQRLLERAYELRRKRFAEDHDEVVGSRIALAEIHRLQGEPAVAVSALEALASEAERLERLPRVRGEIHFQLAQARWAAGQQQARVQADLARAREFLEQAGAGGAPLLGELEVWEREHARDDRPRGPDGQILPVDPDHHPAGHGAKGTPAHEQPLPADPDALPAEVPAEPPAEPSVEPSVEPPSPALEPEPADPKGKGTVEPRPLERPPEPAPEPEPEPEPAKPEPTKPEPAKPAKPKPVPPPPSP